MIHVSPGVATPGVEVAAISEVGPNQPAGFVKFNSRSFDATTETGWSGGDSANLSIVTDSGALVSPSNVGRCRYVAGSPGAGVSLTPIQLIYDLPSGKRDAYVRFIFKPSSNFQQHPSEGTKIFFLTQMLVFLMRSAAGTSEPLTFGIDQQSNYLGTRRYEWSSEDNQVSPTYAQAQLARGSWSDVEVYVRGNDLGSTNGEIHAWVNGVKILQFTGRSFLHADDPYGPPGELYNLRWEPIWGGSGGTVNEEMYQYMDHIYVSGPA